MTIVKSEALRSSDFNRRTLFTAIAGLPMVGSAENASGANPRTNSSRTLVAYFTRSGNTRVVAGLIHRSLSADVFEIKPASPYPEDYLQTVTQAGDETKREYMPSLAASVQDLARYEVVYLGFPIWGETAPPIIRSFLSIHDLSGKALVPLSPTAVMAWVTVKTS